MRSRALVTVAVSGLSLALAVAAPADAFGKHHHGWPHHKHKRHAPAGGVLPTRG